MKLKHLDDKNLLSSILVLAQQEREILSKLLWHLKEIDERKLYSSLKCASLFDYCVKVLKYSEGQASRRVTACRLLRDLPEIMPAIEKGKLNLTHLNQAKSFFNDEGIKDKNKKKQILKQIEATSTRESEKILWEQKAKKPARKVSISIKEETFHRFKKLQGIKAHTCPNMEIFFDKACSELELLWNPMLMVTMKNRRESLGQTRYISRQDKAVVWQRDQGKCQNCGGSYALEFDHIHPYALGGKSKADNLQLLCRNCNQRKAIDNFN